MSSTPTAPLRRWIGILLAAIVILAGVGLRPFASYASLSVTTHPELSGQARHPLAMPTPSASMFSPGDRLAHPPMSDPPTQVEMGHHLIALK